MHFGAFLNPQFFYYSMHSLHRIAIYFGTAKRLGLFKPLVIFNDEGLRDIETRVYIHIICMYIL